MTVYIEKYAAREEAIKHFEETLDFYEQLIELTHNPRGG